MSLKNNFTDISFLHATSPEWMQVEIKRGLIYSRPPSYDTERGSHISIENSVTTALLGNTFGISQSQ